MTRIPLSAADEQRRSLQERLSLSTAEIGLSVRTTNCLEERGIFSVQDLLHSRADDLLSISNFGEKTLEEVYDALGQIGFQELLQELLELHDPRSRRYGDRDLIREEPSHVPDHESDNDWIRVEDRA